LATPSEKHRIKLLVERDGEAAARAWVERTLKIYREAINHPGSHPSTKEYRPAFEQSIREFEEWLATRK
jgi:hypothetical protein